MTFEAYIENIRKKTGRTPEELHELALAAGIARPGMTASQLAGWLKSEFDLGHGHAMAIWAVFKDNGWAKAPK